MDPLQKKLFMHSHQLNIFINFCQSFYSKQGYNKYPMMSLHCVTILKGNDFF